MSGRKLVAFFGEWNTANLGDHAIREGVARLAAELGVDPLFVNLGSLTVGSHTGPSSGRALRSRLGSSSIGRRLLRPVRAAARAAVLRRRLKDVAAVVVGGGALLSTDSPQFPRSLAALRRVARHLHVPMACVGCSGSGTWEGGAGGDVVAFLSSCRLVATRDTATARRVAAVLGHDVPVFGDFAFTSAPPPLGTRPPVLGINPINLGPQANGVQSRTDLVLRAGQEWQRRTGGQVKVFTTGLDEDAVAAAALADEVVHPRDVAELRDAVAGCGVVIATRLHAAIIAMDQGVPVVGVATTEKLRAFFEDCGLGAQVVDVTAGEWGTGPPVERLLEGAAETKARPVWPERQAVVDELSRMIEAGS